MLSDTSQHVAPPPHAADPALYPPRRDRAFSFEVFNFSSDDLLPPPPAPAVHGSQPLSVAAAPPQPAHHPSVHFDPTAVHPAAPTGARPRGDSIIFDPVSFQDGGIHENRALDAVPRPQRMLSAPPPAALPLSNNPIPAPYAVGAVPQSALTVAATVATTTEVATLPSSLSAGIVAADGSSPATFQMELLNKGGRIGIYLPEARKQRIARFHAKRKMRIWRKRIKYDCRKKLADSRPRIKGRFVKRSDMGASTAE